MMPTLLLPPHFALVYYRFTLVALDKIYLPPYKGSAIRGGFGHTFKKLVCTYPRMCNKSCQIGNDCPYGYVFETAPPPDARWLFVTNEGVGTTPGSSGSVVSGLGAKRYSSTPSLPSMNVVSVLSK